MVSKSQLPAGMEHCTIKFIECPEGHGRLTANNWFDDGSCPYCVIVGLRKELKQIPRNAARYRVVRESFATPVPRLTVFYGAIDHDAFDKAADQLIKQERDRNVQKVI